MLTNVNDSLLNNKEGASGWHLKPSVFLTRLPPKKYLSGYWWSWLFSRKEYSGKTVTFPVSAYKDVDLEELFRAARVPNDQFNMN